MFPPKSQPVTCDRSTASPYWAEGLLVFNTASRVQAYRARIRLPSYLMSAANKGLEDPDLFRAPHQDRLGAGMGGKRTFAAQAPND